MDRAADIKIKNKEPESAEHSHSTANCLALAWPHLSCSIAGSITFLANLHLGANNSHTHVPGLLGLTVDVHSLFYHGF